MKTKTNLCPCSSKVRCRLFGFRLTQLFLLAILFICRLSPAAIVTFTAGNETAPPASPVTVAITVTGFNDVYGFSFSLQWNPSVVQFNSIANLASLPGFDSGDFNTTQTSSGRLGVLWNDDNLSGETLANASKLFDLNFTTVGAAGTSTPLAFSNDPVARDVVVIINGMPTQATFSGIDGSLAVVPEPINVALGVFAVIFAGMTLVRGVRQRTTASGRVA